VIPKNNLHVPAKLAVCDSNNEECGQSTCQFADQKCYKDAVLALVRVILQEVAGGHFSNVAAEVKLPDGMLDPLQTSFLTQNRWKYNIRRGHDNNLP